ncbi:hypothetical protein RB600_005107 [Gaeumannomyces tritici]
MAMYTYRQLDTTQSSIRTMRLARAKDESEPIWCDLDMTVLSEDEERGGPGVSYEALSYTWGDSSTPQHILVNGGVLPVTANLHRALVHLRLPTSDRVLWVDAVCIDQGSPHERTHQVGQMQRIYGQAERVLIWLGPATIESCLAMPYLLQVDQAVLRSGRRLDTPDAWRDEFERGRQGDTTAAVVHHMLPALFESPWFRRIWVIQEAASAKAALVMYGHDAVPARTFAMLSTLPSIRIPEGARAALEVMPSLLKRLETSWWHGGRDLLALLCKFRNYEATDPRDKVYALLGISEGEPQIKPDYEVTEGTVRWQVNRLFIGRLFPDWSILDWDEINQMGGFVCHLSGSIDQIATSFFLWRLRNIPPRRVAALLKGMPGPDVYAKFEGLKPLNAANAKMIKALAARKDADIWSVGTDGLRPLQAATLDDQSMDKIGFEAAAEAFTTHNGIWENEVAMELIADEFPELLEGIKERRARMGSDSLWEEINNSEREDELIMFSLTLLGLAAYKGFAAMVKVLLANGADVNPAANGENFMSPLFAAVAAGHVDVMMVLLDAGANPNPDNDGDTCCLQAANMKGDKDIIRLLDERRERYNTLAL